MRFYQPSIADCRGCPVPAVGYDCRGNRLPAPSSEDDYFELIETIHHQPPVDSTNEEEEYYAEI